MPLSPVQDYLVALHARIADLSDGNVADYIPELAKADPEWFGICIATRDGHVYEVGDTIEFEGRRWQVTQAPLEQPRFSERADLMVWPAEPEK